MKKHLSSFFEISLQSVPVGFSSVIYDYNLPGTGDTLSAELFLFSAFYKIDGIQVASEWPVYEVDYLSAAKNQDETLTKTLLRKAISNYSAFEVCLKRSRDVFELDLTIGGKEHPCLLVHECLVQPPYKQVQILQENRILRFPMLMEDAAIVNEVRALLEKVGC